MKDVKQLLKPERNYKRMNAFFLPLLSLTSSYQGWTICSTSHLNSSLHDKQSLWRILFVRWRRSNFRWLISQCWNVSIFSSFTATPLCPHVALRHVFLDMCGPEQQWTSNLGSVNATLFPLSSAHYVFPSKGFYVYFLIYCLHLFWAATKNTPSGWFTTVASCVWLAFPHGPTSQKTKFYLQVKPQISLTLFLLSGWNCNYAMNDTGSPGLFAPAGFFCKQIDALKKKK